MYSDNPQVIKDYAEFVERAGAAGEARARRVLPEVADRAGRDQGPRHADAGSGVAEIHPRAADAGTARRADPDSKARNERTRHHHALRSSFPSTATAIYGGAWHAPKSGREADTINPGTGESLGKVADGGAADVDAAVAAAKAAFKEWRNVPPLERAKMLRRIAEVLRKNAQELAMIDAADCGNPVAEMVSDAMIAAAQTEFFAGFVTEMKGSSIPMGPDAVNFSVREPRGVVGAHHPVQSSVHVLRRKIRRPARGRQHRDREAAGAVAALLAAARRADRRHPAARRVQRDPRRQGSRRGARGPSRTSRWSR